MTFNGRARTLIALILILFAVGCSPLITFKSLVPKDAGADRILTSAAFGNAPRQKLDLYAPTTHTNEALPIIIFFYGGSWNSGTKDGYSFVGKALAARGFLVAIPDYRLVPEIRYPTFLEDNAAAVRWVIAHGATYHGDPHRIILAGHSAGAYDAAMLAVDPRWLGTDRKLVRGLIGLAGPYNFTPFRDPAVFEAFKGVTDQADTQPVNHVSRDAPPAFLATGDKDTLVGPVNSDDLSAKLSAAGVYVERKRYPKVGHVGLITAIAKPFRGNAPVLDDMIAFAHQNTR